MIHASRELIEAMKGRSPPRIPSDLVRRRNPQDRLACVVTMRAGLIPAVAACIGMGADRNAGEDKNEVDCPACLALMAEARGPERTAALAIRADELEERAARIDYLLLNAGPPGSPTGIAILAQAELERRRDYCRRSIAAIRSAVPVVPGVAKENER